jgi:hypothetical protein
MKESGPFSFVNDQHVQVAELLSRPICLDRSHLACFGVG